MLLVLTLILALLFLPWPWSLVAIAGAACGEVAFAIAGVRYSRHRRGVVGVETLVGLTAEVVTALAPTGQVKLGGEIWQARSEQVVEPGDTVRIKAVNGLTLEVERVS